MPYAWDYPAMKDKILILQINGQARLINIKEIGSQVPFSYPVGFSGQSKKYLRNR